jgi:hypothetical protein
MSEYQFHPYANLFPFVNEQEFEELKQDIKAKGLLEPIWLYEDKILDGRSRYKACFELDAPMEFRLYNGNDPLGFVVSLNLNRRHLTSGQKAALAVELLPMLEANAKKRQSAAKEPGKEYGKTNQKHADLNNQPYTTQIKGKQSSDKAANLTGSNRQYVSDAKKIKEVAPEVFEKVKTGKVSILDAKKEMKHIVQKQEAKSETWESSQLTRKNNCLKGLAVVANQKTDNQLIGWAKQHNKLVKCDRSSEWSNPFEVGKDGNREEVIDSYHQLYLPHKHELIQKIPSLKGKVLVCTCYPKACHCDKLAELANSNNPAAIKGLDKTKKLQNEIESLKKKIVLLENEKGALRSRFFAEIEREKKALTESFEVTLKQKEATIKRQTELNSSLKSEIKSLKAEIQSNRLNLGKVKSLPAHSGLNKELLVKIRHLCHPDKHENSDLSNSVSSEINNILKSV